MDFPINPFTDHAGNENSIMYMEVDVYIYGYEGDQWTVDVQDY